MVHSSALLATALASGIAIGVERGAPSDLAVALTLAASWAASMLGFLRRYAAVQISATVVLVASAGWVLGAQAVERALHPPLRVLLEQRRGGFAFADARSAALKADRPRSEDPVVIEGRLRGDAVVTEDGVVLRIDVDRVDVSGVFEPATGGIAVGVSGGLHSTHLDQWTSGRRVRAPVHLRRPARYLNEGVPDQERALARRGVSLVGTIKSAALIDVVAAGWWWEETAARIRARTREALLRHIRPLNGESAAIATAILIGDRSALSVDVEQRLQEAGTYHVIAISGGNIAILAGLLIGVLRLAGVRGRVASCVAIGALAAYALIAAGGASVLRATLMAVIYLAVRLVDQRTGAIDAISLTAVVVLLAEPLAIADVGFWLTFGATAALVTGLANARGTKDTKGQTKGTKGTKGTKDTKGTKGTKVREILAVRLLLSVRTVVVASACVELALAPIATFVFQRVTVAGLLLNVVALPAMTGVQIGAMTVVLADWIGWAGAAGWMGQGVSVAGALITESARLLDFAPWLTWRAPSPHPVVMGFYYSALITAAASWWRMWPSAVQRWSAVMTVVLFLWIVTGPEARIRHSGDGRLHLTMIDVGQGDSLLATFPNGRTLLIDAGGISPQGDFDVGDRIVGPALRARGLLEVDYLCVTHGDPDHLGGAAALLRDFGAREVWWGVPVPSHTPTADLRAEADRQRISWRTLQRGDRVDIGGVELRVHHPPPPDWERQRVRNNDSLVIELRFGAVSMLLTGDIGQEVEEELAAHLDTLPIVVLKVAHHGSATSSSAAFLNRLRPTIALIGVGRGNTYGHPVPSVLGRLHESGAEVFRTDLDGQVDVVTDGKSVEVRTFTGRKLRTGR